MRKAARVHVVVASIVCVSCGEVADGVCVCVCVYNKDFNAGKEWMSNNASLGGDEEISSSNESSPVPFPLLTLEESCDK